MGGPQIKTCINCRHNPDDQFKDANCVECWEFSQWQTKRGAKAGVKRKPGAAKTGPKKFEDRGELKQIVTLSFKSNDIKKAGGYQKVKEYLTKAFKSINHKL